MGTIYGHSCPNVCALSARPGAIGRALGKPVRPEWPGGFASLYQMETISVDGLVASGTVAKGTARFLGAKT